MSYRNDVDALAARKAALDVEVDARTKERDDAARMLAELHARAKLPVLPNIRIATPCTADWNAMTGDERVRHCASCDKDVFNLSAMTRAEAEALLVEKNANLCARYYQRKDGTILLADCEVGRSQQRRLKLVGAGLLVTITASAAVGTMVTKAHSQELGSFQGSVGFAAGDVPPEAEYTAIAGGVSAPPPPPTTGIPECDAYRDSIYELAACDALPPGARTALLDAYAQAETAWAHVPAEGQAGLATACIDAAKVIRGAIRSACPPEPIAKTPLDL